MHPLFAKADRLSAEVIGAAIEVHRIMGPGLLESIYERCLGCERELRGIPARNQQEVVIEYKSAVFKEKLKFDLLAEGCLLVELKAIRDVLPIHKAQLLSYMKRNTFHGNPNYAIHPRNSTRQLRYSHRLWHRLPRISSVSLSSR